MAITLEHLTKKQRIIFYLLVFIPIVLAFVAIFTTTRTQPDQQNKVKQAAELSINDKQERVALLKSFLPKDETSGIIFESTNVRVEYVESIDGFLGEILTENITEAKDEAVNWFLSQGISKQGICSLPLNFYLNKEVRDSLKEISTEFNLLPPGC